MIAKVSRAALEIFLFCFLNIINSSEISAEVLKDHLVPFLFKFIPRDE